MPPSRLRINGYAVEGYELKGIIPKWGELSRDIEDEHTYAGYAGRCVPGSKIISSPPGKSARKEE